MRQHESELTQKETANTAQTDHTKSKQNSNKNIPNTTEQWTTNIPYYTIGSSEQVSPPDTQKKKFKHSTPPSQTSEVEDVEVEINELWKSNNNISQCQHQEHTLRPWNYQ